MTAPVSTIRRSRFARSALLMLWMPLSAACGGTEQPDLPPAPEHGMQLVTPEITVEPFDEIMSCWYTTIDTDADVWVEAIQSWQGDAGHHVIGFITDETTAEVPDGTVVDCIDPAALARYVPVLTPTLTPNDSDRFETPESLALKLTPGTRLVIQSHYINISAEPLQRQDVVNLWFTDPVDDAHTTAPWMTTSFKHSIPPGGPFKYSYDCPVEQSMSIYSIVGHMHEAGTEITIKGGPANALETLYHVEEWESEYRDNPPLVQSSLADATLLNAGDILRVSCSWDPSKKDHFVTFPEEMCAALLWGYPADRPLFCGHGAP